MSHHITVVGAGQSGLLLAAGLLDRGYRVRVVSDRTPPEIAAGRVSSSQCMFASSLAVERELGLDFWAAEAPPVEGISFAVPGPPDSPAAGTKVIDWASRLDGIAQSVDQRLKMPKLIDEFVRRGGEFVVETADVAALERYHDESDLVVVAAGKGDIARLFERDATRSPYDRPQRALALTYVHGLEPRPEHSAVAFNLIPGVGEYFVFPALTLSGPCEIMVFEGVPGGPMDCWGDVRDPAQHLETSLRLLRQLVPWEADRAGNVRLTDDLGVLAGRFPPTVRHPVATLPSGRPVLGMADVVVLNDPITGQGSNNAAKCAASYLRSILAHGDQPFDRAFLRQTFETYWDYARYVTDWTNALLAPPPPHVLELLTAANTRPDIAHRFVNGFDDPRDFFPWFADPVAARDVLAPAGAR
ncbi:styrene monooxygenase/indole monooxygenase family protein [Amycolatopsis jejuensis]|uniref:styrene monooxygenase/indole monooxygenase family protein n=1 Tax=Amycolatopsis jejuensis TaxID=330084 RepID=UPI0005271B6E|nr:styrene monooxygenase/indole monooxygenase family protein [Amycolatopsis jejuensis]